MYIIKNLYKLNNMKKILKIDLILNNILNFLSNFNLIF